MTSGCLLGYLSGCRAYRVLLLLCAVLYVGSAKADPHPHPQRVMSLDASIEYAVNNSYEVIMKSLELVQASADVEEAFWSYFPTVKGYGSVANNFGRGIDPATNSYTTTGTFNNNFGLEADMPIYAGGQLVANARIAKLSKRKAEVSLAVAKDGVAEMVLVAYVEALYNAKLIELRRKVVESYMTQEERLTRMQSLGGSSSSDLAQLRATLSKEQLQVAKAQLAYDLSIVELKRAMNYPLHEPLEVCDIVEAERLTGRSQSAAAAATAVVEIAKSSSQKVAQAAYDVDMGEISLITARRQHIPSLHLASGASTQYYKEMGSSFYAAVTQSWSEQMSNNLGGWIGATLSIPIFNGMQTRYDVRRATNSLQTARRTVESLNYQVEAEVHQLLFEMESLQRQRAQSQENIRNTHIANQSMNRKFQEGAVTMIDLQISNNELLEAQIERVYIVLSYYIKERMFEYYNGKRLYRDL